MCKLSIYIYCVNTPRVASIDVVRAHVWRLRVLLCACILLGRRQQNPYGSVAFFSSISPHILAKKYSAGDSILYIYVSPRL